ncbi:MAG: hypothetical protein AAFV38_11395, partial [Pseudomonadota bacterium]
MEASKSSSPVWPIPASASSDKPAQHQGARYAVTSISIFIAGSISPHSIIVATGGLAPKASRNSGQQAGASFADVVRVTYILPDRADFEPC